MVVLAPSRSDSAPPSSASLQGLRVVQQGAGARQGGAAVGVQLQAAPHPVKQKLTPPRPAGPAPGWRADCDSATARAARVTEVVRRWRQDFQFAQVRRRGMGLYAGAWRRH